MDKSVVCWGADGYGAPKGPPPISDAVDAIVELNDDGNVHVVSLGTGASAPCVVLSDGTARGWGENGKGNLGNGTTVASNVPITVPGLTNVIDIVNFGDLYPTAALLSDGSLSLWGGINGPLRPTLATSVGIGAKAFTGIFYGSADYCVYMSGGTLSCGSCGFLGSGTVNCSSFADRGFTNATAGASADIYLACVLHPDGSVECESGLLLGLGIGSDLTGVSVGGTTNSPIFGPVVVPNVKATSISAHQSTHVCVTTTDGNILCWGSGGSSGGFPGPVDTYTPVMISGISGATSVATGDDFTCAIVGGGSVQCYSGTDFNHGTAPLYSGVSSICAP